MHWEQFIIVGTWKLLQLASEICRFRHGATSRWTSLPGLVILLCLAIASYKLQQLRIGMGQMAKKSGLLRLLALVINQTRGQNFGIENIAPLITRILKHDDGLSSTKLFVYCEFELAQLLKIHIIEKRKKKSGFKSTSAPKINGCLSLMIRVIFNKWL